MKIVFKNNLISIDADRELVKDNNKIVVTEKKGKTYLELKTNTLNLLIKDSIDLYEEYQNEENINYSLEMENDIKIRNVCLIKKNNDSISKKTIINEHNYYEQIVIDLFENYDFNNIIDIDGQGSYCYSRVASMVNSNNKQIKISINHNDKNSTSKLDNYGVVSTNGNLLFEITGSIKKGCKASNVFQNNKIILFDKESKGEIKPLLYIDENDVSASHAAAVGKVDDNHIFYLMSRGIDKAEAKKTIALGYLKPVLEYISDEKVKKEIKILMEKEVF